MMLELEYLARVELQKGLNLLVPRPQGRVRDLSELDLEHSPSRPESERRARGWPNTGLAELGDELSALGDRLSPRPREPAPARAR